MISLLNFEGCQPLISIPSTLTIFLSSLRYGHSTLSNKINQLIIERTAVFISTINDFLEDTPWPLEPLNHICALKLQFFDYCVVVPFLLNL
jgi:hypothetical protein